MELVAPVALVFPGQGVQRAGMGEQLHRRYPIARGVFERAEAVCGLPLRRLCFEGSVAELNRTETLQPAVFTVSWAAFEVFQQRHDLGGVRLMAGHSLGEIAAICAAGATSWEQGLALVQQRGQLMAEAARQRPGGMLAIVGLPASTVRRICAQAGAHGGLWVANHNADVQFVLSGEHPALAAAQALALAAGARRALLLTIPLPAHSPLMATAARAFRRLVERLPLTAPRVPILTNAAGRAVVTGEGLRQELGRHLLRPVQWARTMAGLQRGAVRTVVELGPGRVLAGLAAKHMPGVDTWNADELLLQVDDAA
ncbi:MAG TPA: ACP S-malonyltransferase [Verrucomicrobiae bacterium]|nr:ACP S-malonyltransferase [Verrucomicrobiae bacterium]